MAVHAGNHKITRTGHDKMQDRATVHILFARHLGVATLPQGADIFEQRANIRVIHAMAARTPDQRIAGTQTEFREMLNTKRPQVHALSVWIVNQHRTGMRPDEFHAHETGFLVEITNVLLAVAISGVDGDTVGLDGAVMLDGASQRVWWGTGERCGKHQG